MTESPEKQLLSEKCESEELNIEHIISSRKNQEDLTYMQRLDDWMWHQSQKEFEEHCDLSAPCLHPEGQEPSFICKFVRFIGFVVILFDWALTIHHCPTVWIFVKSLKFFTNWGKVFTLLTFTSGFYLMFLKKKPKKNSPREEKEEDKFSIFRAWKWYIYFNEVALVVETLVSLFFWLLLYKDMVKNPRYEDPVKYLELIIDHILIIFLLLDFMVSTVPFVRRHMKAMVPIGVSYLTLNFIVTKYQGRPIYNVISWDSWLSMLILAITLLVSVFIFLFYEFIST